MSGNTLDKGLGVSTAILSVHLKAILLGYCLEILLDNLSAGLLGNVLVVASEKLTALGWGKMTVVVWGWDTKSEIPLGTLLDVESAQVLDFLMAPGLAAMYCATNRTQWRRRYHPRRRRQDQ